MSDSINALLQGQRSSSVLDAIAHPQIVNPLAAITAGNQAAQQEYETRAWQAKQAAGQAFLKSIDPATGQPNQAALMRNLAADPMTALAAQTSAQAGQTLDKGTYDLTMSRIGRGADALGMLMARFPNGIPADEAYAAIDREVAAGLPPEQAAALKRLIGPDMRQNSIAAAQLYQHNMSTAQQLEANYGKTTLQGYGDVYKPTTIYQGGGAPGTSGATPGAAVRDDQGRTIGPAPGSTVEQSVWVDPRTNQEVPAGTPGAVPGKKTTSVITIPGIPPGGMRAPDLQPNSGSTPSPTPPPPPPGNTVRPSRPPPGTRSDLLTRGSVQMASADSNAVPAAIGTPSPPSSNVPADVAAIQQGIAQARANPSPPGTQTAQIGYDTRRGMPPVMAAPPMGVPEKVRSDVDVYTTDQKAYPQVMTQAQNLAHAWDALSMLKSNTGKGAAGLQNLRSFLGTIGIATDATMNEAKLVDLINKYTTKSMIDAANAGGPATDMARHMAESSNPGTTLGNLANFEVMRNDMGLALQKAAAYQDWTTKHPGSIGAGYPEERAAHASRTDPRGFVWNMYSPEEQAKINADVANNKTKADALHKAMGVAARLKLYPPVTEMPPGRGSFLTPPAAQPQINPLTLAG